MNKYLKWKYFLLFFTILVAGGGSDFVGNLDVRINPLGAFALFGSAYIVYIKERMHLNSFIIILFITLGIWSLYHILTDYVVKYLPYIYLPLWFFVAFALVNSFKKSIFFYVSKIVTWLTLIDLVFWAFQNVIGIDSMTRLGFLSTSEGTSTISFLIYDVSGHRYDGAGLLGLMRNSGFAWEPGRYASICILALFCNMMVNKHLTWKKNRDMYILIIGLLTTFSTSGYSLLLLLFLLRYAYSIKHFTIKHYIDIVIVLLCSLYLFSFPFMGEKIEQTANSENFVSSDYKELSYRNTDERELFTVQRFEGIVLAVQNIKENPMLGYGMSTENSYIFKKISPYLRISNGLTQSISVYGIPLSLFLFGIIAYNSIAIRKRISTCKNSFFFVFLGLNVSYNFLIVPLFISVSMYYFLLDRNNLVSLLDKWRIKI